MLMRHAKSAWDNPELTDYFRQLAPRGQEAAPVMARYMVANGHIPDRILCSSAQRTRETLSLMLPLFPHDMEIVITNALYETSAATYYDYIRAHGREARALMVIGHNPALEELGPALVGVNNVDHGRVHASAKYPTAALAVMKFDAPAWAEISSGAGQGVCFVRPRDLIGHEVDSD